jgi:hypothetical protein
MQRYLASSIVISLFALLISVPVLLLADDDVTEDRRAVYTYDDEYPEEEAEWSFFNVQKIEVGIYSGGSSFHFPGTLRLTYNSSDVQPGNSVSLVFKWIPEDGPGFEYDSQYGYKYYIDATIYEWTEAHGHDFKNNFVPPRKDETRSFFSNAGQMTIYGWPCLAMVGGIQNNKTIIKGDRVSFMLEITDPPNKDMVYFEESEYQNKQIHYLDFYSNQTVVVTMVISHLYLEKNIVIESEHSDFKFNHQLTVRPGLEGCIVSPQLGNLCNMYCESASFDLYSLDKDITANIDEDESDEMKWRFENNITGAVQDPSLIQDLVQDTERINPGDPPVIGEPDDLRTTIRNLHGDICREYESIDLEYWIHDGSNLIHIDTEHLNNTMQRVIDFNEGNSDRIEHDFIYNPGDPNYILRKDYDYAIENPQIRYIVKMVAQLADEPPVDPCADWAIRIETNSNDPGNTSITPILSPLPDFAITSVDVVSLPSLTYGDHVSCTVDVTNYGAQWPPFLALSDDPRDSVYVDCRISFERQLEEGDLVESYSENIFSTICTPIDHNATRQFNFDYILPDEVTLGAIPIDLVRFIFRVNDGSTPVTWAVWERSFINNEASETRYFSEYPDSAFASSTLHNNGENISSDLPDKTETPLPNQTLYLYVADHTFDYSSPAAPAPNLRVWIGVGGYQSSPSTTPWSWYPCTFLKNFTAANGHQYKVYQGDISVFNPVSVRKSYCFRASMDYTDFLPTSLYIDKDGATSTTTEDERFNPYYYNNAGTVGVGGDPGIHVGFGEDYRNVANSEIISWTLQPANFGIVSECSAADSFCLHVTDTRGWEITGDPPLGACEFLEPSYLFINDIWITVPCDAAVGTIDTIIATMAYCHNGNTCAPEIGDCENPNWLSGDPYYSADTVILEVTESSTVALQILQDSLCTVYVGQSVAHVPFNICNADYCDEVHSYYYEINSRGHIDPSAFPQTGRTLRMPMGDCDDVYAVVDVSSEVPGSYDTLTIVAWDSSGIAYDTCVQVIRTAEPQEVPLLSKHLLAVLVIGLILGALIMIRFRTG